MTRRLALAVLLAASSLAAPTVAQEGALPGECVIDEAATVDVLLLLDQSGSLNDTDPNGRRVTGAQAVVRSYATLAERVAQVRMQVAGFGTGFTSSGWQVLDEGSRAGLLDEVATVGAVDSDFHTDYVYAVDGAIEQFQQSTADCRILFWFTDGAHDLDEELLGDGLDRFYHPEPVTTANVAEVEALMPALICDAGGMADQLATLDVSTQVMLLGSGDAMAPDSARVLRGMGGGSDCGPGTGSFEDVGSADELPFRMACLSQPGTIDVPLEPAGGALSVDQQIVAKSGVSPALVTDLRIIARGAAGTPPALGQSTLDGITEVGDDASGTIETSLAPTGRPFQVEFTGVEDACAFATAVPPVPEVAALTPTLYQEEPGEFTVTLDGPHGPLAGDDLAGIQVTASEGTTQPGADGWTVTVPALPTTESFELTVDVQAGVLPPTEASATFTLNEHLRAPRVTGQPAPVIGEGSGPFQVTLEVDGQDGGTLCLEESPSQLTAADDQPVAVTATLEGGHCLEVPAGPGQTHILEIDLDRQTFVSGVLPVEYRSTSSSSPDQFETGQLAVDLELTPVADTALVAAIVAGLLVLLGGLLWATLYGVNRMVGRIPDPRRHGVRFADFTAEVRSDEHGGYLIDLVKAPIDRDLRPPRRTPSELRAGRLGLSRRVPLLPWRAPYAELSSGSDLVAADLGRGMLQRTVVGSGAVRARPGDALGPVVALGISTAQRARLEDGTAQQVPGVLLMDVRTAKGQNATAVTRDLIEASLDRIATELAVDEHQTRERTPRT